MINNQLYYPFCAIVGQEDMKIALILNLINPLLGGVLIRGEKGTGKSTAVRAVTDLLPYRQQVKGCKFSCDPLNKAVLCESCSQLELTNPDRLEKGRMKVVNLPISATEDRVVGTLDIEHALKTGEKKFESGILASANRNILYVDEVNLLDDHVVDLLLDAAAMGVNTVEREGISYVHPSRFIMVGTMNPEEGDLRPQLIDRFGLSVEVRSESAIENRVEIVKRRLAFEADQDAFVEKYKEESKHLGQKIEKAKELLPKVSYSTECLKTIAEITIALNVDGHRADITFLKAAITHAAFYGRTVVSRDDLYCAAKLALPHRMRRKPFEEGLVDFEIVHAIIEKSSL